MKKLMIVGGVLALSILAYGEDLKEPQQEAEVKITAEVVQPLELSTKEVKFGKVGIGTKGNTPKQKGEILIKGEKDAKIKVQFKDNTSNTYVDNSENLQVALKKEGASTTLQFKPVFDPKSIADTIASNGENKIAVTGSLDVPTNTTAGEYSGSFSVKVWYE